MSENREHANVILHFLNINFKISGLLQIKNIFGERRSDDKKVGEFVYFNMCERQTASKLIHGKITN